MRGVRWRRLAAVVCGVGILAGSAVSATAEPERPTVWLCAPGQTDDPCAASAATTVREAGQPDRIVDTAVPADPGVDCFYVYPTVSLQPGPNADYSVTPELRAVAQMQAARFSEVCHVYAPVYRQRTLVALSTERNRTAEQSADTARIAYADVLRAWREFTAGRDPKRPVVLIGHSQGTRMLRQLLREEIEPDPVRRAAILSAILLGGNVVVPKNADVGGDFRYLPLCRSERQTGCVVAFQTFDATPPADSRFGRNPSTPEAAPRPYGPDYEVACTNPASWERDEAATAATVVRANPVPSPLGLGIALGDGPGGVLASTPWLVPAATYSLRCVHADGASVLMATPNPGSPDLPEIPDAGWGLHIADVEIALGDLVRLVAAQTAARPVG